MSILLPRKLHRRSILRGSLSGAAVSVGLPFLDMFLNSHGTALAAGQALPVRFGTWFWGLGHTPGFGVDDKKATGPGITLLKECEALKPHEQHINYFGNFNTPLDGRSNYTHFSGWVGSRTGTAPANGDDVPAPTFDLLIAEVIGTRTRFKTLDVSSTGNPSDLYSAHDTNNRKAAEVSPIAFYARLFGPEFVDPNKADFTPDPRVMLRKSVLSSITEERQDLAKRVGASDKAQIDQYFTSIRELEGQLELQLQKPAPNEACVVMPKPAETAAEAQQSTGVLIETVDNNHKLLTKLLAMAVACNQTAVFNMVYSASLSQLRKAGETNNHHSLSHEEPKDPKLGYQPEVSWFNTRSMQACANFIEAFAGIREGSGTLLDNCLIFAGSETSFARVHSVDNIPVMTLGKAGGRIKTGLHVVGNGDPITRIGLTTMKIMGVEIESWGTKSLQTGKVISDILV